MIGQNGAQGSAQRRGRTGGETSMANFRTHIAVGVVASGMASTLTMAASVVPPSQVVTLALCGALGSILPDIDLQNSRASQAMFNGLGLFIAFAMLFKFSWKYSIAEMWIIWVGTFLVVRFFGHRVFHKFAVHRGIFHSVIAGLFFAFLTAAIFSHLFKADATLAWLAGTFMLLGYLVHLALDEIYSVDFHDNRIKRSFGTALKLIDFKNNGASLAMATAAVIAFFGAPAFGNFYTVVGSQEIWEL